MLDLTPLPTACCSTLPTALPSTTRLLHTLTPFILLPHQWCKLLTTLIKKSFESHGSQERREVPWYHPVCTHQQLAKVISHTENTLQFQFSKIKAQKLHIPTLQITYPALYWPLTSLPSLTHHSHVQFKKPRASNTCLSHSQLCVKQLRSHLTQL